MMRCSLIAVYVCMPGLRVSFLGKQRSMANVGAGYHEGRGVQCCERRNGSSTRAQVRPCVLATALSLAWCTLEWRWYGRVQESWSGSSSGEQ